MAHARSLRCLHSPGVQSHVPAFWGDADRWDPRDRHGRSRAPALPSRCWNEAAVRHSPSKDEHS